MEEKYGHKSKNRYDLNPDEEVLDALPVGCRRNTAARLVLCSPTSLSAKRPFYAMDDPGESQAGAVVRPAVPRSGNHDRRPAYPRLSDVPELGSRATDGMDETLFESFTMLHKYGMPPHGGLRHRFWSA